MSMPQRHENNLFPGNPGNRRAVEKMRSKLVTAGKRTGKGPALVIPKEAATFQGASRAMRNLAAFLAMVTATANIYAYLEKDELRERLYPQEVVARSAAEPDRRWTPDEKALFHAYSAWDRSRFDQRFGPLPEKFFHSPKTAAAKLEKLLASGKVTNAIVLSEINRLRPAPGPGAGGAAR